MVTIKPRKFSFAIKAEFTCSNPKCKKLNTEVMYTRSSVNNPDAQATVASQLNHKCKFCKTQVLDGTTVKLNVFSATLEEAKTLGFKPPAGFKDSE
jgi:hypothetical protein